MVLLMAALVLPAVVVAQNREFSGKIATVGEKKMLVDSLMGEQVRFRRTEATVVSDQRPPQMRSSPRESWEDLRVGDSVAVEWRLADKPRKAYRIIVLPPRKGSRGDG